MKEKPNYYAIIPADVRYDRNLKDKAKLLYGEITSLSNKDGYCFASNKYFADLYGVSITTISTLIKNLIDNNYIESEIIYKENSKEIDMRYLKIFKGGYLKKFKGGIKENLKDNNTSINNTSINNIYIVEQVIKHLNEITNSNYKSTTRTTRDKIIARLNEGFTLDDFIVVIDKKYWDWKGTEFEQYMRPETLFGTKFESYLNQPMKKKTTKDIKLDDKFYEELMRA